MTVGKTKHYSILRDYVRKVAEDLVARGRIRREYGQTIDVVIRREAQTVFAEVAGDVRALAFELGIGVAAGGVRWLELYARQKADATMTAGVDALFELISAGLKR